jgi:hypothetical protein
MSRPPRCQRCYREARNAVSADAGTLLLCARHHAELAAVLADDRRVMLGRRVVTLEPPALEGRR